jgi:hypothetical protein
MREICDIVQSKFSRRFPAVNRSIQIALDGSCQNSKGTISQVHFSKMLIKLSIRICKNGVWQSLTAMISKRLRI